MTICPTLILGPGIGRANVVSEEFVKSILMNITPNIKCASNYYSDVRDVARAHLRAIQVPEAKNRRFMVHGELATKEDIRDKLTTLYGDKGFTPGCDTIDDKGAVGIVNDNSASKEVLGMKYHPLEQTLKDMTDAMVASGVVKASGEEKSWWQKLFG